MITVRFISASGQVTPVQLTEGETLMQAALMHGIDGITGECGGSAMCATCHCYVEEPWGSKFEEISELEEEMLGSTAAERRPSSRLSCQLHASAALDGAAILLPECQ